MAELQANIEPIAFGKDQGYPMRVKRIRREFGTMVSALFLGILLCAVCPHAKSADGTSESLLSPHALAVLGYQQTEQGLLHIVSGVLYQNEEKEKKLDELETLWKAMNAPPNGEVVSTISEDINKQIIELHNMMKQFQQKYPDNSNAWNGVFDASAAKIALTAPDNQAVSSPAEKNWVLEVGGTAPSVDFSDDPSPWDPDLKAQPVILDRYVPPPNQTLQASPAPTGMARGNPAKILRMVLNRLPDSQVRQLAATITAALVTGKAKPAPQRESLVALCAKNSTAGCLNAAFAAYFSQDKKSVNTTQGWDEVLDHLRNGFRGAVETDRDIRFVISHDRDLLRNRGLWVTNPLIEEKDGAMTMIVNSPWLTKWKQYDWELKQALLEAAGGTRWAVIREALDGQHPDQYGTGWNYALAGWSQGKIISFIRASVAAGRSPEQAQDAAYNFIMQHPLHKKIYEISRDAASKAIRDTSESLPPRLYRDQEDGESNPQWLLVTQANQGNEAALKEIEAMIVAAQEKPKPSAASNMSSRQELGPTDIEYARPLPSFLVYLNTDLPQVQAILKMRMDIISVLARHYSDSRDSARGFLRDLARQGDAQALDALVRFDSHPSPADPVAVFHADLLKGMAQDPKLSAEFADLVTELSGNTYYEGAQQIVERKDRLWFQLASSPSFPTVVTPHWKSLPTRARLELVRGLASDPEQRKRLERLKTENPEVRELASQLTPVDSWSATVRRRVLQLVQAPQTLEAAGQKIEAKFHGYPQAILSFLSSRDIVEPFLVASQRSGFDPYFLAAAAFQEGYIFYASSILDGTWESSSKLDSFHDMGIDSFADYLGAMKKNGHLRTDFNGFTITGRVSTNEAGHAVRIVQFDTPSAAVEAMSGVLRFKKAQFKKDAKDLGIDVGKLSLPEIEMWTYLYYNFRDPKKILSQHGVGWVWKDVPWSQHDIHNVKRVGATAQWLRDLRVFDKGVRAPNSSLGTSAAIAHSQHR
jgi:hypothetical protein